MITLVNVYDAIPILMRDDNTFNRLKEDFPDILADLITFKNNPSCTCRTRVLKFFGDILQNNPGSLDKYVYDANYLKIELDHLNNIRELNNYSGRVFTLPKDEESWKNFAKDLNRGKTFRSFSVVERENEIAVYFI